MGSGLPHLDEARQRRGDMLYGSRTESFVSCFFPSGAVPLGVWKLPCTTYVDLSGNLLTHLTGETAPDLVEYRLVARWSRAGREG